MKQQHSREYAIEIYNQYLDEIGVFEEDRISSDLSVDDKLEIQDLLKKGLITEEEAKEREAQSDVTREKIIRAIRRGILILDDTNDLVMNLRVPIKDSDGNVTKNQIKINKRFSVSEFNSQYRGSDPKDVMKYMQSELAARAGVSRVTIERLDYKDYQLLQSIHGLFTLAD